MNEQTTSFYQKNTKESKEKIKELTRKANTLSLMRFLVIVGGGALLFQVVRSENVLYTLLSFILVVLLFLLLVMFQSKNNQKKRAEENFLHVNENELAVAVRINQNSYDSGSEYIDDHHIYTSDLDVFGDRSIYQMINRSATFHGKSLLASWLSHSAEKPEIESRQQFVKELADDFPWWQDLQAKLYAVKKSTLDAKKLISHYLVNEIQFSKSVLLKLYTKVIPYLFILLFALTFYSSTFISVMIGLAIFNFLLSIAFSSKVTIVAAGLNKGGEFLAFYIPALEKIEERKWTNEKAQEMQKHVEEISGMPVSKSIKRLSVLLNRLDARLNLIVGAVLNMFLLWDFRQVYALKDWQNLESKGILEAMDMLSTVEAIGSLATLQFNHSEWVVPVIVDGFPVVEVENIEHPLIPEATSIANTYSLADHRIALITGSNMAGKSTFLRTIGINTVLALCGAAVHATSMKVSVMQIATYMRIRDSLNESTSTFKAELDRIQKILELVKNSDNTFILLDEMLRGTNSMDKYLGSKAIIEKLIKDDGVGMVATHDLKLSELSDAYPKIVKNYHFDIQVIDQEMLFDYKLKTGPCTTFNASLLLKKIGIEI